MKNLLVFASGDKDGGGSGFKKLVEAMKAGVLQANIVGVVSNYATGGVYKKALELEIPFFHFSAPWTQLEYQRYVKATSADFVALSGWLKLVYGLDPKTTFNIHPGPLPNFGGRGMYGHYVHEAVFGAYRCGKITHSEVCMHFVTEKYDRGPVFFRRQVKILPEDTAGDIGSRVNKVEHEFQSIITNKVVTGQIRWDGKNPMSLVGAEEQKLVSVGI